MLNSVILVFANKQDLVCLCYFLTYVILAEWPHIYVIFTSKDEIKAKACELVDIVY